MPDQPTNLPLEVSADDGWECPCVGDHRPDPRILHRHHIHPLGTGGPDTPSNVVVICPTTHDNVHAALRLLRKTNGQGTPYAARKYGRLAWSLAQKGYQMEQANG